MSSLVSRVPRHQLPVGMRLVIGATYSVLLVALALWAYDGWPPSDSSSLWFYSAAVAVLFAIFVTEPFYTSPKGALAASAALFLFALTADEGDLEASAHVVSRGRAVLMTVGAVVFLLAAVALLTRERAPRINTVAYPLSVNLGSSSLLFGLAFALSVYASFAKSPDRLAVLYVAALGFAWSPLERVAVEVQRYSAGRAKARSPLAIVALEDPATAIVRGPGRMLAIGDRLAMSDGTVGTVVDRTATSDSQTARVVFAPTAVLTIGDRLAVTPGNEAEQSVVGYVASGTAINAIRVAAAPAVSALMVEEGRLLSASIRGQEVLFQVTGASVEEERLGDERHSRFRVDAQKLGCWNTDASAFDLVPWLPDPGTAVRLTTREEADFDPLGIGFVPGSRYAVRYRPKAAVTHNTAILGILGSGKTTLARELVGRNIEAGIKVVILDITGQYAPFFASIVPADEAAERLANINTALAPFVNSRAQDADGQFGSRGEYVRQLRGDIGEFLANDDPLRIYNPLGLNVTTIDGFQRGGQAEMLRELSLVEKTSFIALSLLHASQEKGETEDGRLCLVIEEAHSLTPEPADGLNKEDHRAVVTTARSVLQGRKYGYGCLLITQRTANVTKTILNQCHTVFALRSYDATGMAFLSNYLGAEYSRLLSTMPRYHCVAFGEGISATAPVVIKLNDPNVYEQGFLAPRVADLRPARLDQAVPAADPIEKDDIPF